MNQAWRFQYVAPRAGLLYLQASFQFDLLGEGIGGGVDGDTGTVTSRVVCSTERSEFG